MEHVCGTSTDESASLMLESDLAPCALKSSWYTEPYLLIRYIGLVAVLNHIIRSSCPGRKNLSMQKKNSEHGEKKTQFEMWEQPLSFPM